MITNLIQIRHTCWSHWDRSATPIYCIIYFSKQL